MQKLWEAMKQETETDTLICQVQAMKDIFNEVEVPFCDEAALEQLAQQMLDLYNKSDERIVENNNMMKFDEEDDAEENEEDKDLIKEENKSEQDLQLSIAELFGPLFKTHRLQSQKVLALLFNGWIPNALANTTDKTKQKFGLFILDDMVEFLGPEVLGVYYKEISQ